MGSHRDTGLFLPGGVGVEIASARVESTDGQPVFPVLHSGALCPAVAFLDHTAAKKGAGAVPCGAGPEELGSTQALGANTPMGHRAHESLLGVRALNCKSVG